MDQAGMATTCHNVTDTRWSLWLRLPGEIANVSSLHCMDCRPVTVSLIKWHRESSIHGVKAHLSDQHAAAGRIPLVDLLGNPQADAAANLSTAEHG
eukprot:4687296-Amphidinium_carterae.1